MRLLRIFSIKESKVYIQLRLSIYQEFRDDIRQSPQAKWRKKIFLNRIKNVHNRGPKNLGQKGGKRTSSPKRLTNRKSYTRCHLFTRLLSKMLCCPLSFLQLSKYLDSSFTRVSLPYDAHGLLPLGFSKLGVSSSFYRAP